MAKLYERFPLPTTIDFRKLYSEISEKFLDSSVEEYMQIFEVIRNTFEWLHTEHFIRFNQINNNSVQGAQLTEKGLKALKAIPRGLDTERPSLAEFLAESAKAGAKEALMKGIGFMISGALSGTA